MSHNLQNDIGDQIIMNAANLAESALNLRAAEHVEFQLKSEYEKKEAIKFSAEFIRLIGEGLKAENDTYLISVAEWGERLGEVAIGYGQSLEKSLIITAYFRNAVWSFIENLSQINDYSAKDIITIAKVMDPIIDRGVQGFSLSFVKSYNKASESFNVSLQELSVPVVPIFEGIAILPLIGDIDTNRAKILMDHATQRASDLKITKLILDLSGVSFIDTMVANHIFQLGAVLELIGVKTIITGVSPAIAQTSVQLNINLDRISTYSSLKQALTSIGYGYLLTEK